jgi:hypothetical protein
MAGESGDLSAKALGEIPLFFFDLIARVAPGLLLLFGLDHVSDRRVVPALLYVMLPNDKLRESPPAWLLVLAVTGYILGHLISPLVKQLDNVSEKTWKDYDKLRAEYPSLIPIVMRIRAEYMMYGGFGVGLSAVVGIAVLDQIRILWTSRTSFNAWWAEATHRAPFESAVLFLSTLVAIRLMFNRNRQTMRTFESAVHKLCVAKGLLPPDPLPKEGEKAETPGQGSEKEAGMVARIGSLLRVFAGIESPRKQPAESAEKRPASVNSDPSGAELGQNNASRAPHP